MAVCLFAKYALTTTTANTRMQGLEYLPAVARRLHHSRDIHGEPFDFITWFEYAPEASEAFEEMVKRLRATPEWGYVSREVDIRLTKVPDSAPEGRNCVLQ